MHESRERKSEQTLKELKDLKSQMTGVRRGRSCPLGISSLHCDRTTDTPWELAHPLQVPCWRDWGLGRHGLGVPTPTGFHTGLQGLRASQYLPLFYLTLELLFGLFDKSSATIQYWVPWVFCFSSLFMVSAISCETARSESCRAQVTSVI